MAINKKPLCGMAIKHYLWLCINPDKVKDYYNNVDFGLTREKNLELIDEHAAKNIWPKGDLKIGRRLIIRSYRILEGLKAKRSREASGGNYAGVDEVMGSRHDFYRPPPVGRPCDRCEDHDCDGCLFDPDACRKADGVEDV